MKTENSENKSNFFQSNAELLVFTGLIAACVVVYAQATGFQYINFDDNLYVYENTVVLSGLNSASISWAFTTFHSANWHPLTWLSHMLDASLFGSKPGAHHATNVVFHIINSLLAFIVFRKMTGSFWKSAIVAALFAVHPTHVESVAWISERKDVLSTLFWLLTMLAYFNYVNLKRRDAETRSENEAEARASARAQTSNEQLRTNDERTNKGQLFYFLTILFFALGLMAKPMLVTLPFVLLLCDYWSLERLKTIKDFKPLIIEKLPLFILSAISAYVTVLAQKAGGAVQSLEMLPFGTRLLNAIVSYAKYIWMLFYPVDLGVSYPYQSSFAWWQILGAIVLLIGITIFCWMQRNERKYLLMGWLWFLGTLVPVIGIVQVGAQSMADRYTYVPYFGLFIMLVWGAGEIFSRLKLDKKIVAVIISAVLIILCVLSFKQASYWRTPEALYRHTLDAKQGNFLTMHNYCNVLMVENRLAEAEKQCLDAIAAEPNYVDSYNSLGIISVRAGKLEEAVKYFKKSLEIRPNDALIYTNQAAPLAMLGRTDEAAQSLEKAADLYRKSGTIPPVLISAFNNLASAYAKQNRYDKSAEALARVLQFAPNQADIRANYALSLYFQDKLDEARSQIEQAIRQNPNQAESYNIFGMILLKQNRRDEAAKQFERAVQLKPDFNEAKENLRKAK